ncbi:transcription regulatory protein Snf2p [Monosporozyma servazzii]
MNIEVPQKRFSKEEIARCYIRWQQLRNEHGENAPNVPEFVFLTKTLQVAAKHQQELQQQNKLKNNTSSSNNNGSPAPTDNIPANSKPVVESRASPLQVKEASSFPTRNLSNNNNNNNNNNSLAEKNVDGKSDNNNNFSVNMTNNGSKPNKYVPPTKRLSLDQAISPKSSISNESPRNYFKEALTNQAHSNKNTPDSNNNIPLNGMKRPSPKQNVPGKQHPNSHPNIFTSDQSNLLRAQITALKCLVNHQNVPSEFQSIIQQSISHPPDFRKMLMSLSEYVKMKTDYDSLALANQRSGQSQAADQRDASINQQLPQHQQQVNSNNDLKMENKTTVNPSPIQNEILQHIKTTTDSNDVSPRTKTHDMNANNLNISSTTPGVNKQIPGISNTTPDAATQTTSQFKLEDHAKVNIAVKSEEQTQQGTEIKKKIIENEDPPKQAAPIPLGEFRKMNPTAERIIEIEDPDIMVDSYTLPSVVNSDVPYETLFPKEATDFTITPSVLPEGIDTHTATEIYQTLVALNLDTAANDCISVLLSDSSSQLEKRDAMADYRALQLLPLQKAIRGHVLQFEWYQNALLTNTHPNFLSKIRNINIQDTVLTDELYRRYQLQQYDKKKKEESMKMKSILDASAKQFNSKLDIRNRRLKFGHKVITLHGNLEKEEQKRQERKAKERLQALKSNDEEAYIKLLDQTKDTRITHLLRQTNEFLESLTKAVKDQQKFTKGMIESHLKEESEDAAGTTGTPITSMIEEPKLNSDDSDDDQDDIDYYNVAHKVREETKKQPSILIGGTLKEYQLKGLQWMVSLFNNHLNGILADEMGLGKTIQTISLLTYLYETKNVHGPFLVIVPLSTLSNWTNEFEKWAPTLRTVSFKGSPAERKSKQATIKSGNFDVVVTTFEYIIKEKALLSKVKWVHMIIDEGHRMKNAQSKLSLTLNTYYHSDYRLILTGTPLQNNLPELWALLNFVLPKIFNSVKSFDEWFNTPFANTGGQDKIELSEEETLLVIRRLHKVLRPFLLRRLKKDVEKDLPDKVEKVIKCKMSGLQQIMYQQMLKRRRLYIGDHGNKKMVSLRGFNNQLMQLKKICNHPFVFEEVENQINPTRETNVNIWRVAGKFELLERVLPKLKATGHRALIFFQMTQIMDIMEDFLRLMDIKYLRLDGHTKSDERSELLRLFNAPNSEFFCFILSTRAGGLGLNLQTADTVIIFDTDWNPHQDLQAQDRAHRIGQKNEVRILRLITEHSVEEAILEKAHKKLDIDGKVIQAGKFDNKSTAEEQEALLRSLLEAEEDRRKKREAGELEEDELNDNEINQLLARNDNELIVFSDMDNERVSKDVTQGIKSRLLDITELPDIYSQEIPPEEEKPENEVLTLSEGRSSRDKKITTYNDELSEEQWLKQFEVSDDDGNGGRRTRKRRSHSNNPSEKVKQVKLEDKEESSIPETPLTVAGPPQDLLEEEEDTVDMGLDESEHSTTTAGKTSIKSARTSTKSKIKKSTRTRGKSRARSRGIKSKNGLTYNRILDDKSAPIQVREVVASQAEIIYEFALSYKNEVGRVLSPIFEVKPPKNVYPDYYLLIKYPCAFENIRSHIDNKLYNSLFEVLEDFHLVFANARVYNTEESVVYSDSLELEKAVSKKYQDITKDNSDLDFSEFDSKFASTPLVIPTSIGITPSAVPSPTPSLASPISEPSVEN